ncbi:hypothetical protein [Yoonia sp. SS1-5]|uniref:DNA-directed DNA polymerase n=1 Tax=Yoonia rhodophyticola TaxID=3137370 RepID=A0AAN0NH71_9RHOB
MRKPETIERLYLDFDGFFASVEQQARPALRGKPIGIVPFEGVKTTCVIAASSEAKQFGVKNVMNVADAKRICPGLILVPQTPDLYRRAHNTLLAEIGAVLPIDAVKSIDELTCRLDRHQRLDPERLSAQIKDRISRYVGPYITCSIGFAPNRHLAKIAGKQDKPNGTTIWHPNDLPNVLHPLPFDDIPGIGSRMERRLGANGIFNMEDLLRLEPKHMRKIWRNVSGERLWYALHGYDIQAGKSERGMFGHGRVLPPDMRSMVNAFSIARMLLVKAARRMRTAGYYASRLMVWCQGFEHSFGDQQKLPIVSDDHAVLTALRTVWLRLELIMPKHLKVVRVGVTLGDLSIADQRQLDMLLDDDVERRNEERLSKAIDHLNRKYSKSLVTRGPWIPPKGGHLGGKISYTRIPNSEDFW